jgi:hypothetical protein
MFARIKAAWAARPWYKGIFVVVGLALAAAYYFFVWRKDTTQPDLGTDPDSWKKSETDPAKPIVDKPLSEKEIADETAKIDRELNSRK